MNNSQKTPDKRNTGSYDITPKPPPSTPRGFQSGYLQRRQLPILFIVLGVILLIVAFGIMGGIIYLSMDTDNDDNPTSIAEEPTATQFVVGETQQIGLVSTEITPSPSNTLQIASNTPFDVTPQSNVTFSIGATQVVDDPTTTFTFAPPTQIPATITPLPTHTPTVTSTFTATVTPSPTQTFTATFTPSNTPLVSHTPTTTFTTTATVPSPTNTPNQTGRLIRMYYDQYSFYAWNASQEQILVSSLAFEAIDGGDLPVGKRMDGSRWGQFYGYLERNKCGAVEITQSPQWLRPSQCFDYNAILTPQRSSRIVFWLPQDNVATFRVLWNEQEIGRCDMNANQCDVFIP